MSLISLKELLMDAKKKKYGVFATNAFTFEMAETIIRAGEEKRSPVILMIAEDLFQFLNPEITGCSIIRMIKKSTVPVVFHLDHGMNFENVVRSLDWGYNSIMFDGSKYSLAKNIEIMKELRKLTGKLGISLEGEVGYVGGLEAGEQEVEKQQIDASRFTKVEDAVEFTYKTEVDALAIAVGTIHGRFRFKPDLDFKRITEVYNAVEVPLVLHGSSGLSDKDFKKAIACGITKINYFTDLVTAATEKTSEIVNKKEGFSYLSLNKTVMESVKEKIKEKMDIFGSSGKA